ncbi:hypothetical protein E3J84_01000 [Candidatus Aerophobetes bacterium]|uniref:Uroporphyrinogen decarboxylase (URO-D) domain-containing protein n=1 Tax=Aerophobetes bacterium TaxID=2030807 RepID=A0A523S441_UNCAE|nr:MAG: hypothetical protein E3J84_01000 [Candidatus Aerophobetes bacterium]
MTSRERVLLALNHKEADRVSIYDAPWIPTLKRWHDEGFPSGISAAEYFDYDIVRFSADTSPRFPIEIVEESEEYIVITTPFGGLRREHKDYSTTPQILDYPCKSPRDWPKIKERLVAEWSRVDWQGEWEVDLTGSKVTLRKGKCSDRTVPTTGGRPDWGRGLRRCREAHDEGKFICYTAAVGYDKIQNYVATERLLMAVATEPEWVRDMYETDAKLVVEMYRIMKERGFEFDGAWLSCDLGYRNGLFFSPYHFKEQLRPTFKYLFDYFKDDGLPVILHSDGYVQDLVPYFIADGLTCLQPLETKAGMDLLELKKNFGHKLAFMGGIDVRSMADLNPSIIEDEIKKKLLFAKKGGGYIYCCDADSVPENVSFDRYCQVIELVKKYGSYRGILGGRFKPI